MPRSDYLRMDRRNPYGSKGGYVTSGRRARDMARDRRRGDRLMMDDMRRYERGDYEYSLADMTEQNQEVRHDPYTPYGYYDERRGDRRGGRGGRDGHDVYPVEFMGTFGMPSYYDRRGDRARNRDYTRDYERGYDRGYGRDYAGDYGDRLTREELNDWSKELMSEIEEKDRQMFSRENVLKKAQEMGIKFDEANEDEFYVTTLMMLTDYCKTLGTANMDLYLKLAKDWLWDEDAEIKGGEKLAVYFDNIVNDD